MDRFPRLEENTKKPSSSRLVVILLSAIALVLVGFLVFRFAFADTSTTDTNEETAQNDEQTSTPTEEATDPTPTITEEPTPTDTEEPTPTPTPSPTDSDSSGTSEGDFSDIAGENDINVYFSRDPQGNSEGAVYFFQYPNVNSENPIAFAIEKTIESPTSGQVDAAEEDIFSPIALTGESNCGGDDFKITRDSKDITIQFCRELDLSGNNSPLRVRQVVKFNTQQFFTNEDGDVDEEFSVTVLKKDGGQI